MLFKSALEISTLGEMYSVSAVLAPTGENSMDFQPSAESVLQRRSSRESQGARELSYSTVVGLQPISTANPTRNILIRITQLILFKDLIYDPGDHRTFRYFVEQPSDQNTGKVG